MYATLPMMCIMKTLDHAALSIKLGHGWLTTTWRSQISSSLPPPPICLTLSYYYYHPHSQRKTLLLGLPSVSPFRSLMKVKESEVTQLCPTLCDPMDYSLPGSSVHGIFQARVLEWVAISFSRGCSQPRDWTWVSHIAGRRFTLWATREAAAAKSLQSWPTLCNPIDGSPPGSAIPGILQARTLEWVAISFSTAWKWKVKVKLFSHVRLF